MEGLRTSSGIFGPNNTGALVAAQNNTVTEKFSAVIF